MEDWNDGHKIKQKSSFVLSRNIPIFQYSNVPLLSEAKLMIRTIFVWSCIVIATLVLGFFAFITYFFDRKGRVVHRYARLWGKTALLANRVKVKIEGMEHLNGKGPYLSLIHI